MKRSTRYLLVAPSIALLVLLVFPQRAGVELALIPLWATAVDRAPVEPVGDAPLLPVEFDSGFAYLDRAGRVAHRGRTSHAVALSPAGFVNHSRFPAELVVQAPDGSFLASLPVSGYPTFAGGRTFVALDAGGAISEWDDSGTLLWRRDLPGPVVSLDATSRLLALGLAGGGPLLVDRDGGLIDIRQPMDDTHAVVHAIAVGESPARLAVLSGAPEATLTVYEVDPPAATPILVRRVGRPDAPAPLLAFAQHSDVLYVSVSGNGPRVERIDLTNAETVRTRTNEPAIAVSPVPGLALDAVLTVGSEPDPTRGFARRAGLTLLDPQGRVAARTSWAASSTSLLADNELILIRVDARVLAVRPEVR